jgi:hypothetical protein
MVIMMRVVWWPFALRVHVLSQKRHRDNSFHDALYASMFAVNVLYVPHLLFLFPLPFPKVVSCIAIRVVLHWHMID